MSQFFFREVVLKSKIETFLFFFSKKMEIMRNNRKTARFSIFALKLSVGKYMLLPNHNPRVNLLMLYI